MRQGNIYKRRELLLGGLTLTTIIAGGALLSGSSRWPLDATARKDSHLLLAVPWNGLDFTWLAGSQRIAVASNAGMSIIGVQSDKQSGQQSAYKLPLKNAAAQNSNAENWGIFWSSDGTKAAYISPTELLVYGVLDGRADWSLSNSQPTASVAALSPDGRFIAYSQAQSPAGASEVGVTIWDVRQGKALAHLAIQPPDPQHPAVKSILWSPDSTRLATTDRAGRVQLWNAVDGRLLWSSQAILTQALSWSPDGASIAFVVNGTGATAGQAVLGIWDALGGQQRFTTPALVGFETDQRRQDGQVAWSPDGTQIAFGVTARSGSAIEVWSIKSAQRLFICQAVSGQPTTPTWSPDGRYLAAGNTIVGTGELTRGDNGERSLIQFWDAHSGRALFAYSAPKSPQQLTWAPDSSLLAIITPRAYGTLANATCLSLCRYGYNDYVLEIFSIP